MMKYMRRCRSSTVFRSYRKSRKWASFTLKEPCGRREELLVVLTAVDMVSRPVGSRCERDGIVKLVSCAQQRSTRVIKDLVSDVLREYEQ